LIGEMFGLDRIRPIDYERAVVVDARSQRENEQDHSLERTEECAQKRFDTADIVRDVR
jgi:hypothetical protein